MGEAMHISETTSFSLPSEPLGSLALILAVLAIVESVFAANLGSVSKREAGQSIQAFAEKAAILHNAQGQWMTISTTKTLLFGLLVLYSYLTTSSEQGMGYIVPVDKSAGPLGLGMLNNRVAFVGTFVEMLFWGYLWTTLKDEVRQLGASIKAKRDEMRENGEEDLD
jgi:Increased loss of mitochondrial DNA protein 1